MNHPYLLLTWSQSATNTDAHRDALSAAGVPHDYWEFDVRGQFPDSLADAYRGVVWSWDDRLLTRLEDRATLGRLIDSGTPVVLLGTNLSPDGWLESTLGVSHLGKLQLDGVSGAESDSVWAATAFGFSFTMVSVWAGGHAALTNGDHVVATRAGDVLVSGLSPLALDAAGRADYLRRALYAVTGSPDLAPSPTSVPGDRPAEFELAPVFPNPASGAAVIRFTVGGPADVRIEAFDLLGRRVESIWRGLAPRGAHEHRWLTTGLPAGVYFVSVSGPAGVRSTPVIIAH
ncbi:MAG: T9SS type A sorting domain-containing protein [Rhodothermales bacterium]|nr:T9SS type A sorting domain-containing protein [Rhodothermales bacterium]